MARKRAPIRKVQAAGVSGAVTTLVLWILATAGISAPAGVAAALTTLVAAGMAYAVPSAPGEPAPPPEPPFMID